MKEKMKMKLKILVILGLLLFGASLVFAGFVKDTSAVMGGTGWISNSNVATEAAEEQNPSMASDSQGNVYVAYERYTAVWIGVWRWGIFVAKSSDGGLTWSVLTSKAYFAIDLSNPSLAIATSRNNEIMVAYERSDGGIEIMTYIGGTQNIKRLTTDIADHSPSLTFDLYPSAPWAYIVYEHDDSSEGWSIKFMRSRDSVGGWNTWDSPYTIVKSGSWLNPITNRKPSIAYGHQIGFFGYGYLFVSYQRKEGLFVNRRDIYVMRNTNWGWVDDWSSEPGTRVSDTSVDNFDSSITASHTSPIRVVVAYTYSHGPTDDDIVFSYSTDSGSTWPASQISQDLASSNYNERHPRLAADASIDSGSLHVAYWKEETVGERHNGIYYRKANYATPGSWSAVKQILDSYGWACATYNTAAICSRPKGGTYYAAVAWTDERYGSLDILYATEGARCTILSNVDIISGRTFTVVGEPYTYTTPMPFSWPAGYSHSILITPTTQTDTDIQYVFTGWSDGNTDNPRTIPVSTTDTTYIANFKIQYKVTFDQTGLDSSASGALVVIVNGATKTYDVLPFSDWFDKDSTVTYFINHIVTSSETDKRFLVESVTGPASPITVTNPTTVTGNYKTQYLITVISAHGSPTPSDWVDKGATFTASVTSPDDDGAGTRYLCTGYRRDGGSLEPGTSYIFENVQAPHTIEFEWSGPQYRLIVTSAHDSPNPSGENWYDSGTSITASVTSPAEVADTRYRCTGWTGTGSAPASGTTTSTTFTITAPSSITWNWVLHQYRITFTQYGPETGRAITITVNGNPHTGTTTYTYSEWVDKDSSATFSISDTVDSATAGKRYTLKEWKNSAGTVITSPQTITGPNTFTAHYKTQYSLTVSTNPTGLTPQPSLAPSGTWHDAGTSVTCTAPTVSGYTFDHWTVDGTSKGTGTNPITVSMDTAHTATAYYTAIPGANPPPTAVTLSEPSDINQTSMKLTWTQNTEADFARYEIYQSNASGTLGTKIHEITDRSTTSYNVTGLTADTTYYFTIKTVDTSGQSTNSNQVTAKTQAEAAPTPTWMLWVIGGIIAILVIMTATIFYWLRIRKSKP